MVSGVISNFEVYPRWMSRNLFTSKVSINYNGIEIISPTPLGVNEIAKLTGAIDGSVIDIVYLEESECILFRINNTKYYTVSAVRFYENSPVPMLENFSMNLHHQYRSMGIGLIALQRQVIMCQQLGISRIKSTGEKRNDIELSFGYYVLPRWGFNAPIPSSHLYLLSEAEALPEFVRKSTTLHELFTTIEGRRWWREYGETIEDLYFDTNPASPHVSIMNEYIALRNL